MSIRVLLVDDEPDMRMLLRLTLDRTDDIEVVGEVASGPEALEQVGDLAPDVVLLDYHMPGGMTGLETAERMFAAGAAPLVVLFTAWATEALRQQAFAIGIQGFLSKDDFSRVAESIREVTRAA